MTVLSTPIAGQILRPAIRALLTVNRGVLLLPCPGRGAYQFNVSIANGNNASDEPGTLCYDVAQGNPDKGGNQANGKKVKLPGTIRCP